MTDDITKMARVMYLIEERPPDTPSGIQAMYSKVFNEDIEYNELYMIIESLRSRQLVSVAYDRLGRRVFKSKDIKFSSQEASKIHSIATSDNDINRLVNEWKRKNKDMFI